MEMIDDLSYVYVHHKSVIDIDLYENSGAVTNMYAHPSRNTVILHQGSIVTAEMSVLTMIHLSLGVNNRVSLPLTIKKMFSLAAEGIILICDQSLILLDPSFNIITLIHTGVNDMTLLNDGNVIVHSYKTIHLYETKLSSISLSIKKPHCVVNMFPLRDNGIIVSGYHDLTRYDNCLQVIETRKAMCANNVLLLYNGVIVVSHTDNYASTNGLYDVKHMIQMIDTSLCLCTDKNVYIVSQERELTLIMSNVDIKVLLQLRDGKVVMASDSSVYLFTSTCVLLETYSMVGVVVLLQLDDGKVLVYGNYEYTIIEVNRPYVYRQSTNELSDLSILH